MKYFKFSQLNIAPHMVASIAWEGGRATHRNPNKFKRLWWVDCERYSDKFGCGIRVTDSDTVKLFKYIANKWFGCNYKYNWLICRDEWLKPAVIVRIVGDNNSYIVECKNNNIAKKYYEELSEKVANLMNENNICKFKESE